MKSTIIRNEFIKFYERRGHKAVKAVPIVSHDDPSLLFVNAGMNPFKGILLGNQEAKDLRVVNSQPCLRVSGKHNDLEDVGIDTYHHTLFEMLGIWSFGDYLKEQAINWAWELLTDLYAIPKDRLYATIFEGSPGEGVPRDNTSKELWGQYLPKNHILVANKKDNFWEMGSQGPCGPSTEVHVDLRSMADRNRIPGASLVNQDHSEVIEVGNWVFIQYNRLVNGNLVMLPEQHVDTGIGFERLCMTLQGKKSTYDTDIFSPLFEWLEKKIGFIYGKDSKRDVAMRVIVDHIRALHFAIGEGALPGSQKAGYVVRRMLRRAVRYGYSFLQLNRPFLYEMVEILGKHMGSHYAVLQEQEELVKKTVYQEEVNFLRTLSQGVKHFTYLTTQLKKEEKELPGNAVFELYDTYGFPHDLTALMAREKGYTIDEKGFTKAMREQQARSKQAAEQEIGDWQVVTKEKDSNFIGYDTLTTSTKVVKYRSVVQKGKKYYQMVLATTPFYPAGGGQVGDQGVLVFGEKRIEVMNTHRENDLIIHTIETLPDDVAIRCEAMVDTDKRTSAARNHSATHLLQATLKEIIGDHVEQRGSLVAPDRLRFDFDHSDKIEKETIIAIEEGINSKIRANIALQEMRDVPFNKAKKIGATALFNEKYGEKVRVISFGREYSIELCGGTHVQATGEIGYCKIISEKSIAAGVRRIEAITGKAVGEWIVEQEEQMKGIAALCPGPNTLQSVAKLLKDKQAVEKELEHFKHQLISQEMKKLAAILEQNPDKPVAITTLEVPDKAALKKVTFDLRSHYPTVQLVLAARLGEEVALSILLSRGSEEKGASSLLSTLAPYIDGKGGGSKNFAFASGGNPKGVAAALKKAKEWLEGGK